MAARNLTTKEAIERGVAYENSREIALPVSISRSRSRPRAPVRTFCKSVRVGLTPGESTQRGLHTAADKQHVKRNAPSAAVGTNQRNEHSYD